MEGEDLGGRKSDTEMPLNSERKQFQEIAVAITVKCYQKVKKDRN